MKGLTAKEEEIMGFFWEKGPLFVKEMLAFYEEPSTTPRMQPKTVRRTFSRNT